MIISIGKPNSKRLDFRFESEDGDAAVPMREVFITGDNLHRVRDGALSLIAFLMVRDALSSRLGFDGLEVPAYQAAIMRHSLGDFEFFCHPISFVDKAILPALPPLSQQIVQTPDADSRADVVVRRTSLGFEATRQGGLEKPASFVTNAPLFCGMACRAPVVTIDAIMALIAMEVFGAIAIVDPDGPFQTAPEIRDLVSDSGLSLTREVLP